MLKIAVIGTAGRGADFDRLSSFDFHRMCSTVHSIISDITKEPYLISGGAAWADHIAINLFNLGIVNYLQLYLPANWDIGKTQYKEEENSWGNHGKISNNYHKKFSNKVGINSLAEIDRALQRASYAVGKGFFDRNNKVASAQAVITLTFGDKAKLKDGGTADTFGKYLKSTTKNVSYHVDLNDWKVYTPATL